VKGLGRIVRGQVSGSGGIVSGTGFTVALTGTGVFNITIPGDFRVGIIELTAMGGLGAAASITSTAAGATFTVNTFVSNTAGAFSLGFQFVATEAVQA
jgi:hypothetical protein